MLDSIRIEQYKENNFLHVALEYFEGLSQYDKNREKGILSNLVGYELNIYLAEQLAKKGYGIQQEVPIEDRKIDILSHMSHESHDYECKAVKKLKSKIVVRQIKSYKGHYHNVHVFVCKDTRVSDVVHQKICDLGADIIYADITKKELLNRIASMKREDELNKIENINKLIDILNQYIHSKTQN